MAKSEESFKAVLKDIAENPESTRSDIARRVGMSAMNIGRLVNTLIESHAVLEGISPSGSRHSLPIILNNEKYFLIFDFSGWDFSVLDVSMLLDCNAKYDYSYDTEFGFCDNMRSALALGNRILKSRAHTSLAGVAVIMPQRGPHDVRNEQGEYDYSELPEISDIEYDLKRLLSLKNVSFISYSDAVAPAVFDLFRDARPTYYVSGGKSIRACFCADEFSIDIPAFPEFKLGNNRCARDVLNSAEGSDTEDIPCDIQAIYNELVPQINASICPERVLVDLPAQENGYVENEDLKSPKVMIRKGNIGFCVYGAALILRNAWIDRVVARICNKKKNQV